MLLPSLSGMPGWIIILVLSFHLLLIDADKARNIAIVDFIVWFYITDFGIAITHSVYIIQGLTYSHP